MRPWEVKERHKKDEFVGSLLRWAYASYRLFVHHDVSAALSVLQSAETMPSPMDFRKEGYVHVSERIFRSKICRDRISARNTSHGGDPREVRKSYSPN